MKLNDKINLEGVGQRGKAWKKGGDEGEIGKLNDVMKQISPGEDIWREKWSYR